MQGTKNMGHVPDVKKETPEGAFAYMEGYPFTAISGSPSLPIRSDNFECTICGELFEEKPDECPCCTSVLIRELPVDWIDHRKIRKSGE